MAEMKKKTKSATATPRGPKVSGSLPLYGEPQAINSVTHRDVGVIIGPGDFQFAAKTPIIQLTVDEFERASLDYPIVFFGTDRQPYAVTGLEAERNLFVAEGIYRGDAYVPAYLRRYPFVFARDEGSDALILCLDHESDRVAKAGERGALPLFEGDEPTAVTRQALEFCENYEAAQNRTRALIDLLVESDLLEAKKAHYTAPGESEPTLLLEYLAIERARLEALDSERFLRLRAAGALPAIYAQIASQAKWEALAASRPGA
jgi:hypothetical protein